MKARPWLVVTEDGKRPWHREFRVRYLERGRVAYWWGQYQTNSDAPLRPVRMRVSRIIGQRKRNNSLPNSMDQRLADMHAALSGNSWTHMNILGAMPHVLDCDINGYVGIAWLPDNPWPPLAVWPGWKHLAHAPDCQAEFARLEAMSDEELVAILDTPPEGVC